MAGRYTESMARNVIDRNAEIGSSFRVRNFAYVLRKTRDGNQTRREMLAQLLNFGLLSFDSRGNFSLVSKMFRGMHLNPELDSRLAYFVRQDNCEGFRDCFQGSGGLEVQAHGIYTLPETLDAGAWRTLIVKCGTCYPEDDFGKSMIKVLVARRVLNSVKSEPGNPRQRGTFSVAYQIGDSNHGRRYHDFDERTFLKKEYAEEYLASFVFSGCGSGLRIVEH